LPLDPDFFTGKITASTLTEMGYADACRYLEKEMTPAGLPFAPEATQMKSEGVGVTFSKAMQGGFTLGAKDAGDGYLRGQVAATLLTLHVTVRMHDAAEFISSPGAEAEVTGNISYPEFGDWIPLKNAALTHLLASDGSGMVTMHYSMEFQHEGQEYRLCGEAQVRDTEAGDVLAGVTELRCTLYRGTGAAAVVAGAGILTLDASGVVEMVRTLHATNAHNIEQKTRALYDFGRFYLRGIWDEHVSHLRP